MLQSGLRGDPILKIMKFNWKNSEGTGIRAQTKADMMLLMVTIFWGSSYLLTFYGLEELEGFNLNALRFLIAFFAAVPLAYKKLVPVNINSLKYSALLGVILTLIYLGVTLGVTYTSLTNVGFLCALTVVVTPTIAFFFKGQKVGKRLIVSILLALAGIALMTLNEKFHPALGDIFCIGSSVAYSVHLLITETAVQKEEVNALQLGIFQLGFAGAFQLLLSLFFETPKLPSSLKVWSSVLILAILCTGLAFIVQTIAQQYTSASHVGVIFSLEPVFAALVAYFVAGEVLKPKAYVGSALLLLGLLIMEIDIGGMLRKHLWPIKLNN